MAFSSALPPLFSFFDPLSFICLSIFIVLFWSLVCPLLSPPLLSSPLLLSCHPVIVIAAIVVFWSVRVYPLITFLPYDAAIRPLFRSFDGARLTPRLVLCTRFCFIKPQRPLCTAAGGGREGEDRTRDFFFLFSFSTTSTPFSSCFFFSACG